MGRGREEGGEREARGRGRGEGADLYVARALLTCHVSIGHLETVDRHVDVVHLVIILEVEAHVKGPLGKFVKSDRAGAIGVDACKLGVRVGDCGSHV